MTILNGDLDSFLPYAILYEMGAGAYMKPVKGQRAEGRFYALPRGAFQVQLAYTGPEAAEVWWRATRNTGGIIKMCQIPADPTGLPRISKLFPVQSGGEGNLSITTTPRPNSGASPTSTASLHIYPLPS